MADVRSYTQGNIALCLGDVEEPSFCTKVEGLVPKSEVIESPQGPGKIIKKHLATAGWSPLKFEVSYAQSAAVLKWIESTMALQHTRMDGSIKTADFDMNVKHVREFYGAVLTKVTFQNCKSDDKGGCKISVEANCDSVGKAQPGSGQLKGGGSTDHKKYSAANFQLDAAGLNVLSVKEVSGMGFEQNCVEERTGPLRHSTWVANMVKFNNIKIKMSLKDVKDWEDWYDSFVEQGLNGDSNEKVFQLDYLDHDLKTVLFSIIFEGVGITEIAYPAGTANDTKVADVEINCYVEEYKLKYPAAK